MKQEITVRNSSGQPRRAACIEFSVPCRKGDLPQETPLELVDQDGMAHPVQTKGLAHWSDGSVKWLHVVSCLDIPAADTVGCLLQTSNGQPPPPAQTLRIEHRHNGWTVDTGAAAFTMAEGTFAPFAAVSLNNGQVQCLKTSSCHLLAADGSLLAPHIATMDWEETGPLRATLRITGAFRATDKARFSSRIRFFAGKTFVSIAFTLHNPRAARHPGGVWDLGEETACLFKDLSFTFQQPIPEDGRTWYATCPETPFTDLASDTELVIYQESSGGEHWQSPNHRNRDGIVPLKQCGYVVEENGRQAKSGRRASPIV